MKKIQYNLAPDPPTPENSEPARATIPVPMDKPIQADPVKDFETLLREKDEMEQLATEIAPEGGFQGEGYKYNPKYSKAKGNASYDDFIEMVKTICARALKDFKVQVLPGEGAKVALGNHNKVEVPYIFFTLVFREPAQGQMKHRYREEVMEKDIHGNIVNRGAVYGQVFDCIVQFDIAAADYASAQAVMNSFEEAMFKYTFYFKNNGVSELLFHRQFEDSKLEPFRDHISIRSLQYKVRLEKLFLMYDETINHLSVFVSEKTNLGGK